MSDGILSVAVVADTLKLSRLSVKSEWLQLRRAILAQGGIGPSPDWPRDWYPGDLYRSKGKAPDLVAVETHPWSAQWGPMTLRCSIICSAYTLSTGHRDEPTDDATWRAQDMPDMRAA